MQAKRTQYGGDNFRSRLEARWAIFFSEMGLPYQYEPDLYGLVSGYYIPDFLLTREGVWIEVKPKDGVTDPSRYAELCLTTGKPLLLIQGNPWPDEYHLTVFRCWRKKRDDPPFDSAVFAENKSNLWLVQDEHCARLNNLRFVGERFPCSTIVENSAKMRTAMRAARYVDFSS